MLLLVLVGGGVISVFLVGIECFVVDGECEEIEGIWEISLKT